MKESIDNLIEYLGGFVSILDYWTEYDSNLSSFDDLYKFGDEGLSYFEYCNRRSFLISQFDKLVKHIQSTFNELDKHEVNSSRTQVLHSYFLFLRDKGVAYLNKLKPAKILIDGELEKWD